MRGLITLALVVSLSMMLGCGSSGSDSASADATVADLENQVFTFMDGAAFGLVGQAVTLRFGDFNNDGDGNPNTGPVALEVPATDGLATGTATVSSLELDFFDSAGIADIPPATAFSFAATINDDRSLNLTNMATGALSVSDAPQAIPTNQVAFVLTGDFASPLGSYSVVDLDTRAAFTDIVPAGVDSDALPARLFNGRIYVVNRTSSNIQVIDPQQGYTTPIGAQLSVGNGANPHDIAFASPEKAYVSRYGENKLWIINPTTLTVPAQHEIDLSELVKEGDQDGNPEMDFMLLHNGKLYVTLQHLSNFLPVTAGEVAVIDAATDTLEPVIPLHASNPFSELQFTDQLDRGPRILVSTVGDFGVLDGGIEAIDPETKKVDPEFVISEMAIGGEITHFEIVSATLGFAIISAFQDGKFLSSLVSFNPKTGERLDTLFGPVDFFIPHFAINGHNALYLVTQGVPAGIEIFDVTQGERVTTEPLRVGAAPPTYVLFIEQ